MHSNPSPSSPPARRPLLWLVLGVLTVSAASLWWAGRQDRLMGREVAALAQPGDIHLRASHECPPCWMARGWLKEHGVAFSECMVDSDPACRQQFDRHGTPVLLVRGQALPDFDPARLQAALRRV